MISTVSTSKLKVSEQIKGDIKLTHLLPIRSLEWENVTITSLIRGTLFSYLFISFKIRIMSHY